MKRLRQTLIAAFATMAAAMGVSSCSLINDDSDCVDSVNIFRFTYDRNLKFADAFSAEVKSVTLLGFDRSGTLVYARRARQEEMKDQSIEVRLAPGEYDFLVWGGDYDRHFSIASARIGESKLTDFTCLLNTEPTHPDSPDAPETHGHSALELERLYHALVHLDLPYASPSAPNRETINLTKDTNTIRVMLQQQNASSTLSARDFIFEITDRNAHLNHDNSLNSDMTAGNVMYHPWHLSEGTTDYITDPSARADEPAAEHLNVILAELTTSRLHLDSPTALTVRRRSDGKLLFSIPMQQYALMIRSQYFSNMDPQDYLDRQDEFSLTFILDENQKWVSVVINVLNWRVVHENRELS